MERKNYSFPSSGISLNKILLKCGIKTEERKGKKFLVYGAVEIPRPPCDKVEEVLADRFNIHIQYKK